VNTYSLKERKNMSIVRIIRRKAVKKGIVEKKIISSHLIKHGCKQKNFSLSSKQRKGMNVVQWRKI